MRFETKIYSYSADEKIIGAEVTVYDEDGDKIDSIIVTDETQLQRLEEALETIDETYVQYNSLNSILENLDESTSINATKLNGYQGDAFVLQDDLETILTNPKPHASPNTNYGPASTSNYGHAKLRDNLTASSYVSGEALSSHQGYVLKESIDDMNTVFKHQLHSKFMLVKRNGVVQLIINDWDGVEWLSGKFGIWMTVFQIPEGFRPTNLNNEGKYIMAPNIFGAESRLRINIAENKIQFISSGTDTRNIYADITWITDE